ncbi:hypothetical protein A6X21_22510 [Planctopirus hydrillae]|uniref:Uncharacterized protein n=1 Tax=Planctopirus hydrillae TaxID=1841610 RepID=A0A1C3EDE8_9PLAN|nr:hypothetical protein A6X21_22510 [Planctopirus hydrillae]
MGKPELGFREQTVKVVAMQDRRKWLSQMLVGACQISAGSFLGSGAISIAQAQSKKTAGPNAKEAQKNPPWEILFLPPRQRKVGVQALPEKGPIKLVKTLNLSGPVKGHPHLLGEFAINGEFGILNNLLSRVTGANAAIEIGSAHQFELEGMMQAEGTGGWFFLLGWKDGSGHALFQIGTRTSGSPWFHCVFKEGAAEKDSHVEFGRMEWKGSLPVSLVVKDQAASLKVGTLQLAQNLPLRDYSEGGIYIGTYDTQYGPRNLQIQSLRLRKFAEE